MLKVISFLADAQTNWADIDSNFESMIKAHKNYEKANVAEDSTFSSNVKKKNKNKKSVKKSSAPPKPKENKKKREEESSKG